MDYQQTISYLFTAMPSFQNVGGDAYKPGLERIEAFCEALGAPHRAYRVVHIAGTNGKGSTSNMLASVLRASGFRVGLFTSPHLLDFRERMRVDGAMISEAEVVDFVARNRETMESLKLSFFEMTAAMAFDYFARSGVDIAVIETGLGGRLDATNIVDPELSVITNIGLDHTQYLGDTIAKIAAEKGGIIKPSRPVVVGERGEEYTAVFEQIAAERGAELYFAEDMFEVVAAEEGLGSQSIQVSSRGELYSYELDLMGEYQRRNLVTLLAAVEVLGGITQDALHIGLSSVMESMSLRGRWQRLNDKPLAICDTGHNSHGLREVTRQLARQRYNKLYCVLGMARDKALTEILSLFPRDAHFIFTRPQVERAFDAEDIAKVAGEMGLECEVVEGVRAAYARAQEKATDEDMIFIGGSNFVVAELDLDSKA